MKKSVFFEFLNRRTNKGFDKFLAESTLDEDYIDWNGYALPYDYGNSEEEYRAVRAQCAMFDTSPMRKYRITGDDAGYYLDRLLTRPVSDTESFRGMYVIFCNEDGTLKDDAIIYKFSEFDYLLMPSDIDHSVYFTALAETLDCNRLTIRDCTTSIGGVALQGPFSAAATVTMGFAGSDLLAPFEFRWFPFEDDEIFVARMGFTGDLGYEFWMKTELCDGFMQQIVSAREHMGIAIPGYGLSALEACRIEGGFVVAGWDFATEADPAPGFERNPFEVGLGWTVNLDAVEFVGRDALRQRKADGHQYLIRRFQTADEHTLVDGSPVFGHKDDLAVVVGSINCVSWSWGMEKTIGNVSLLTDYAKMDEYWVLLDGQPRTIELSRGPLIKLARRNQVPAPLGIAG